jgi:hypothetical protein
MPDICRLCKKQNEDVLCQTCAELIDDYLKTQKRFLKVKERYEVLQSIIAWKNRNI